MIKYFSRYTVISVMNITFFCLNIEIKAKNLAFSYDSRITFTNNFCIKCALNYFLKNNM